MSKGHTIESLHGDLVFKEIFGTQKNVRFTEYLLELLKGYERGFLQMCIRDRIEMFFVSDHSLVGSIYAAGILCGIIMLGIFITFLVTKLLNHFLFKEEKAMFIMELPTFRKPKILTTIVHAIKDKACLLYTSYSKEN